VELGMRFLPLINMSLRQYLDFPPTSHGILLYDIIPLASTANILKPNDIITHVDGHPVNDTGKISIDDEQIPFEELAERKFWGDKITFTVIRNKKRIELTAPLSGIPQLRIFANQHDVMPRYYIQAGILFQPINRTVINAHKISQPEILYHFKFFIENKIYRKRPELVAITSILPDSINTDFQDMAPYLVDSINDIPIRRLDDLPKAFAKKVKFHIIRLIGSNRPIILAANLLPEANRRIQTNYHINELYRLGQGE
ncbi:MAG: PDZ domain-containing protein, partial [Lentisphaerae bacterium]